MRSFQVWAKMLARLGQVIALSAATMGLALGAQYIVLLKPPNSTTPDPCATGGFTFTKTGTGTFSVSVNLNLAGTTCLGLPGGSYSGQLTPGAVVENVTLNGQDQGANLEGLRGVLTGSGGDTIAFEYSDNSASTGSPIRTLTLTPSGGSAVASTYHVYDSNTIPEPNVAALVVGGLLATLVVRSTRRRRKS